MCDEETWYFSRKNQALFLWLMFSLTFNEAPLAEWLACWPSDYEGVGSIPTSAKFFLLFSRPA